MCMLHAGKSRNKICPVSILNGKPLQSVKEAKLLGCTVTHDLRDTNDIQKKVHSLYGEVNSLVANFSGAAEPVKQRLFNAQCTSFYGSQAWQLHSPDIDKLYVAWKKSLRRLFQLPYMTRSHLVAPLTAMKPFMDQIVSRHNKMIDSIDKGRNSVLKFIVNNSIYYDGPIGKNVKFCEKHYTEPLSVEDNLKVATINELRTCHVSILTKRECDDIIKHLCES